MVDRGPSSLVDKCVLSKERESSRPSLRPIVHSVQTPENGGRSPAMKRPIVIRVMAVIIETFPCMPSLKSSGYLELPLFTSFRRRARKRAFIHAVAVATQVWYVCVVHLVQRGVLTRRDICRSLPEGRGRESGALLLHFDNVVRVRPYVQGRTFLGH